MTFTKSSVVFLAACAIASAALAKLPAPSDEAKAKAAEAAAKAAQGGKVAAYQLCKAQDKAAASYYKTAKADRKETKPPVATPPCVDPGAMAGAPVAVAKPAAGKKK